MSEQLEFDLWVEERLSDYDASRAIMSEQLRRVLVYGRTEYYVIPALNFMGMIVRYRV